MGGLSFFSRNRRLRGGGFNPRPAGVLILSLRKKSLAFQTNVKIVPTGSKKRLTPREKRGLMRKRERVDDTRYSIKRGNRTQYVGESTETTRAGSGRRPGAVAECGQARRQPGCFRCQPDCRGDCESRRVDGRVRRRRGARAGPSGRQGAAPPLRVRRAVGRADTGCRRAGFDFLKLSENGARVYRLS